MIANLQHCFDRRRRRVSVFGMGNVKIRPQAKLIVNIMDPQR